MRERAEMAGGWLLIESTPDAGTTVRCWLPRPDPTPVRPGDALVEAGLDASPTLGVGG
jgi:hypothetical protein